MTSGNQRPKRNNAGLPGASTFRPRKGKLAGSIIAISSAAIVSIYTLGRVHTGSAYDRLTADPQNAAVAAVPSARAAPGVQAGPTVATAPGQPTPRQTASYKDGSYTGTGNSRHGGMEVTAVIKDGKISSANVTSCGTRYPCSDINPLIGAAISKQSVPVNHVSGATDSSKAYTQALAAALKQAKA